MELLLWKINNFNSESDLLCWLIYDGARLYWLSVREDDHNSYGILNSF